MSRKHQSHVLDVESELSCTLTWAMSWLQCHLEDAQALGDVQGRMHTQRSFTTNGALQHKGVSTQLLRLDQ